MPHLNQKIAMIVTADEILLFGFSLTISCTWIYFIVKFIRSGKAIFKSSIFRIDEEPFSFWIYILFSIIFSVLILFVAINVIFNIVV
jgi:hypothetical protein